MSAPDPAGRGPTGSTRLRIAMIACLGVIAVLLGALVLTNLDSDDDGEVTKIGDMTGGSPKRSGAPDVDAMLDATIREADGTETTLREQLGERPLVVNLWSRTCVPCLTEMPWLESVNLDDDRVTVIGVNQMDQFGGARELAEQTGITYEWFLDGAGDVGFYGRSVGLPDTYLIGPDGDLLAAKLGMFADEPALRRWIDENLAEL